MNIANLDFPYGLFLAPMAGVSDEPFRHMCKKYGAEGVYTEMISSRALCYHDKNTELLAHIAPEEHPCFLQIFGNNPDIMAQSAVLALAFKPDVIDINMGCPAPKIAGNGDGSALMNDPKLCFDIVSAVKTALMPYGVPVSVKIRTGADSTHKTCVRVAKACEQAGADMIAVHGRTRAQMYAPPVDLSSIRLVKEAVSVPVVANGDIVDGASAIAMLEQTGCDGLMIGRGAMGNPYLFKEIRHAMDGIPYEKPTNATLLADITEHMTLLVEKRGEYVCSHEARKHIAWYLKGMPGAASYRNRVNTAETLQDILSIVREALG